MDGWMDGWIEMNEWIQMEGIEMNGIEMKGIERN